MKSFDFNDYFVKPWKIINYLKSKAQESNEYNLDENIDYEYDQRKYKEIRHFNEVQERKYTWWLVLVLLGDALELRVSGQFDMSISTSLLQSRQLQVDILQVTLVSRPFKTRRRQYHFYLVNE